MGNYETRFKSFDKNMAYKMLIDDNFLNKFADKTDREDFELKLNDFLTRAKEMEFIKKSRLKYKKDLLDKERNENCTYIPITNKPKKGKPNIQRTNKEFFLAQTTFREEANKKIEERRLQKLVDEVKEVKPKPKMNKVH